MDLKNDTVQPSPSSYARRKISPGRKEPASPDPSLKEHVSHGTKEHPMIGLRFESGSNTPYPKHFFVSCHWHHTVEIILIRKGSYEFEINLERHTLTEGDIVFLNSGDLHQITGFEEHTLHDVFIFKPELLAFEYPDALQTAVFQPFLKHDIIFPHLLHPSDALYDVLYPKIQAIVQTSLSRNDNWYFSCKLQLLDLLCTMYCHNFFLQKNDVLSSYDRQKIARYKKLISYMDAHYSENVTLQQLAELIGCNSQYLCRFFKEITGLPPTKYLIQYRIEQACEMLRDTTKTGLEISLDCGFENVSYFIRKFKELKGCTPKEYRKLI